MRPLLSTADLPKRYGLARRTWEKLRVLGGGPPYLKVGARCLYRPEDVEAWLEARRRTSTSDPGSETTGL